MKDESLENNVITLYGKGWSVRRLSLEFGISRGRIDRLLLSNAASRDTTPRELISVKMKHQSKLDPYHEFIGELLGKYPNITGQRAAHDWSDYQIRFTGTGKTEQVTFFSYILCYSRRQYINVVDDKTQKTLLGELIASYRSLIHLNPIVEERSYPCDTRSSCCLLISGSGPPLTYHQLEKRSK